MAAWLAKLKTLGGRLWRFGVRVVKAFFANQGILLAGSLAYNSMLSAIPFLAVLLLSLSFFFDEALLLDTLSTEIRLLIPNHAGMLVATLEQLLENRSVFSGVGAGVLLFFSSVAFRMLEEAIANIFHVPDHVEDRSFWVSALLPYVFILVIGLAIVALTFGTALLDSFDERTYRFLGVQLEMEELPGLFLYISGFIGMTGLFAATYRVLPVVRVSMHRALVGGFLAAILWEVTRRVLVWYFSSISLVNVIYGSLATVIVVLLSLEVGAVILLLGAQTIAELEHSAKHDLPWYEEPSDPPADQPSDEAREAGAADATEE
ncbi:MAG: YihY/virulence factor BrkB family protein [Persicimonas sp.]